MLNDVILCVLLQLIPECIAISLSNNIITLLVSSILHFSGFLFEFQSFLMNVVLGMYQNEDYGNIIYNQIVKTFACIAPYRIGHCHSMRTLRHSLQPTRKLNVSLIQGNGCNNKQWKRNILY